MPAAPPTRLAAVIGDPVRHSRSPAVHNAAFAAVGLDWVFTAFEVPAGSGAAALDAMRVLRLAGLSVTMPLKAEVASAADSVDDVVQALGAANCIVSMENGGLHAANTDAAGFVAALRADAGVTPEARRVALLGAGGAAKAVAFALAAAGAADVAVINRTRSRAEEAAAMAGDSGRVGTHADIAGADIVVNATSVGMGADISATSVGMGAVNAASAGMGADISMPCDPELLHAGQVAVDLVYEPLETAWLAALRERGVAAHNGLSMLVYQAAQAFELWTGMPAPLEVMRQAAVAGG